jgi:hypothetical protein
MSLAEFNAGQGQVRRELFATNSNKISSTLNYTLSQAREVACTALKMQADLSGAGQRQLAEAPGEKSALTDQPVDKK